MGDIGYPHTPTSPLSHVLSLKTWEVEGVWSWGGGELKVKRTKRDEEPKREKEEERSQKRESQIGLVTSQATRARLSPSPTKPGH